MGNLFNNLLSIPDLGDAMKKALVGLILPLLLGACWSGPDFYADVQNVQPIPAGKYKPVRVYAMFPDDEARLANEPVGSRIDIAYDDRGNVLIKGNDDIDAMSNVRLVTLDANRGLYIVQGNPGSAAPSLDISIYGLIALRPNGYRLSVPPCNGARRLTPGSPVVIKGLLIKKRCSFSDRASFENAMLDFADDPTSWTEYRLVKAKPVPAGF